MKKTTIIIFILIFAGIITSIYIFPINNKAIIKIVNNNTEQIVEKEFIYNHPDTISFPAVVRSSGQKPVETEYKGVELVKLFKSLNIDTSNVEKITFNAADGYRIMLSMEEIEDPKNVYLTFERDGEYLKSKRQGGNGPYQLVIRRDPFSQRWIKHVEEIILK